MKRKRKARPKFSVVVWARFPAFRVGKVSADEIGLSDDRRGFFGLTYKHERIARVRITEV